VKIVDPFLWEKSYETCLLETEKTLFFAEAYHNGIATESILDAYRASIEKKGKSFSVPPKWDGRAAVRIWKKLMRGWVKDR